VFTIYQRVHAALVRALARVVQALGGANLPWLSSLFADEPRPAEHPGTTEHVGATETFGRELRALREVEVSPELVSDIETEMRWGQVWYEFERNMQAKIDRIFAPYLPEPECRNFDELREQVGLQEEEELATPRS
jgi:hypothetical protein